MVKNYQLLIALSLNKRLKIVENCAVKVFRDFYAGWRPVLHFSSLYFIFILLNVLFKVYFSQTRA